MYSAQGAIVCPSPVSGMYRRGRCGPRSHMVSVIGDLYHELCYQLRATLAVKGLQPLASKIGRKMIHGLLAVRQGSAVVG